MMKIFCLFSLPLAATAFAPPTGQRIQTEMKMAKANSNKDVENMLRPFGILTVAASIALSPVNALAQDYQQSSFESSSIQVSEAIKVLDMGLPSYGDISSAKSNQEAIKGAAPEVESATSTSVLPTKKSGGSSLYPAKEKKAKTTKKEKIVVESPTEIVKEDKKETNLLFTDMSMPTYSDSAASKKKSAFAL